MRKTTAYKIFAILDKELRSEYRTRYAFSSILLFILTTITMIIFSSAKETISAGLLSGIIWVVMFFSAMTGLAKSFVSEEERGTGFLLSLSANPTAVYFGKLFFNMFLNIILNTVAIFIFIIFLDIHVLYPLIFGLTILLGSLGIAAATTIISAIIAKANTRNALFPVLSFPMLLPLIIIGIETMITGLEGGTGVDSASGNFVFMGAYSCIVITASYMLFELIWSE